jgi:phosphate:Na+ symporter
MVLPTLSVSGGGVTALNVPLILVHMAGATMLLLYSVRMVRTGVERASGPMLRRAISDPSRGTVSSAFLGMAIALILQSSTAAAVLASGFAASGMLAIASGLALLLGADVGSSIVVQVLSLNLAWLTPILLAVGGWMFLKYEARTVRQIGRILLGIAFILISLHMIGEAVAPLKEARLMPMIAAWLDKDFITAFLFGALLAFAVHSSVATVLLIAALAAKGALGADASISMLLGANLGSGFIAVWLTRGMEPRGRRLPAGNMIFRAAGAITALSALRFIELPTAYMGAHPGLYVVNAHLVFNIALAVISLPFVRPMATLLGKAMPEKPIPDLSGDWLRPASTLDRSVIATPHLALASATREVLRMAQLVEIMLRPVMEMFHTCDREQVDRLRRVDREVNAAHSGIKLYLAEVSRGGDEADSNRSMDLAGFAINLERAGDIIKALLDMALDKKKKSYNFSAEGWQELTGLHDRLMANMQLALNVLLSEDLDSARQLIMEKDRMRTLERQSRKNHLRRLQNGSEASIETSDLHLEIVRSLREINTLFAAAAFPILSRNGLLRESRLVSAQ